jgi:hypothetical protein
MRGWGMPVVLPVPLGAGGGFQGLSDWGLRSKVVGALGPAVAAVQEGQAAIGAKGDGAVDLGHGPGYFAFDPDSLGEYTVYRFELIATFTPEGSSGRLEAGFERVTADAVTDAATPPIAEWPGA